MSEPKDPGHPIGPEVDDTQNPTAAAPEDTGPSPGDPGTSSHENVRDMLAQLQAMIDNVAEQAGPVLREVAAKAAELAAVAGERAGPLAYRAAERTQVVGQKLAQRSKEMATELRRQQQEDTTSTGDAWSEAGVEESRSTDDS